MDAFPIPPSLAPVLDRLVARQSDRAESTLAGIRDLETESGRDILLLGMATVLIACLSSLIITRSIATPLAMTEKLAREVAAGNLTGELPVAGNDEVGGLIRALDDMRAGIATRETRIAELAYQDVLTGLPNRRGLAEALARAIARAQRSGLPLAVLALDLDGLKAINDRYGHPAGDAALVEVAARLRRIIRRSDLVARLGGDEFAIIAGELRGTAPVLRLARRLGMSLRMPIALHGSVAAIDVSIGVAFFPEDGQTTEGLLARADMALYAAKREGAGYRFSSELPAAVA